TERSRVLYLSPFLRSSVCDVVPFPPPPSVISSQNTIFAASWTSRGRLFWLVTFPKFAFVGSVFASLNTTAFVAFRISTLNCARTLPVIGTCLTIDRSHRLRNGLRRPSMRDGK